MNNSLKIKVCGMREPGNISEVGALQPDFMGFIFYSQSSRFIGWDPTPVLNISFPSTIKKVGVFVNETEGKVIETTRAYHLKAVQLHGNESPGYCRQMMQTGLTVFKAFSLDDSFDFNILEAYRDHCDIFLFDTKGHLPGGTGIKFDWQLLNNYLMDVPFFLSGGIKSNDLEAIRGLKHPQFMGVDINSGFEISPAVKDVSKVKHFIAGIRTIN